MKSLIYLFVCIIILAACGPSPEQKAAMTSTALTATAAAWTPTYTSTITASTTPSYTATLSPTPSLTPRPSKTPTPTPSNTPTRDPERFYAPDDRFSLLLPEGWRLPVQGPDSSLVLFHQDSIDNLPNIFIYQTESPFPVAFFSATVQDSLAERLDSVTTLSEDFLVTPGGWEYFRWEFEASEAGMTTHSIMYLYEVEDWKLIVTYTRMVDEGEENDALVEAAFSTIDFSP
jgi:hypothetical protein